MAGPSQNPYVSPTLIGYNANQPTNDGQKIPGNLVEWTFHTGNIGDPLVNFSGDINTEVFDAFGKTFNTDPNVHNAVGGSIGFDLQSVVINTGEATLTKTNVEIDTEAAAATDDLDTITGSNSTEGTEYLLISTNVARVVTVKHGTGNIFNSSGSDEELDSNHARTYKKRGANYYENGVAASSIPSGSMMDYGGATAPADWLLCDGTAVSRTTFADLFAVIAETYGVGDGSTTFNVPDYRSRMSVGAGTGAGLTARADGDTGGEEAHTLTAAEIAHNSTGQLQDGTNLQPGTGKSVASDVLAGSISMASPTPFNVMAPFLVSTKIIKT